jgi:hypothetical protein
LCVKIVIQRRVQRSRQSYQHNDPEHTAHAVAADDKGRGQTVPKNLIAKGLDRYTNLAEYSMNAKTLALLTVTLAGRSSPLVN